jgi:hypothetical protein
MTRHSKSFRASAVGLCVAAALGTTSVFAPTPVVAQRPDTTAVIDAVLRRFASSFKPLVLLAHESGKSTSSAALHAAVIHGAASALVDVITTAPVPLRVDDPEQQELFNQAAWISVNRKYAGELRILAVDFTSVGEARVQYSIKVNAAPRPSHYSSETGWTYLTASGSGRWTVQRNEVETDYEGGYYMFARPELVQPQRDRALYEAARATLTSRGIAVP